MRIIKIEAEPDGLHEYVTSSVNMPVPDGWAKVPDDMILENCPWGEVTAEIVDGVMTVRKWVPGIPPEKEEEDEEIELDTLSPEEIFRYTMRADIDYLAAMTDVELDEPIFEAAKKHYPDYWGDNRLEALREKGKLTEAEYESLISGEV